jgi:hypothetical protein
MSSAVLTDYNYEAFVSYSHSPLIRPWVLSYFGKHLQDWLPQYMSGQPSRVFIDEEIHPGDRWPQTVRDALLTSKCLVPVLSGDYFYSRWCASEWGSFVEREDRLGLDTTSQSLIVPIIHCDCDGDDFPQRAREYQPMDFKDCRSISSNFQSHVKFPKFEESMEMLAKAVAKAVGRAPKFDPTWPVLEIDPIVRTVPLLRIP